MYGTTNSDLIRLYKLGLSSQFIKFIKENNLLQEMTNLGYGIRVTKKFEEELKKQDEMIQFEISHFIIKE